MQQRVWRVIGCLLAAGSLVAWQIFWLAGPINLAAADLGRHLTNGRLLITAWQTHGVGVLTANHYSYTYPEFPFLNHHWGSGVVFYLIERALGMTGLHVVFIAANALAMLIFFAIAWRTAPPLAVWLAGVVLVPLIGARAEVRPEVFSYLLAGVFWFILTERRRGRLRIYGLLGLPLLQVVWVNLHVYFFVGIIIVTLFLLERITADWRLGRRQRHVSFSADSRWLTILLLLTVLASVVNPAGARVLAYPLTMAGNYGYPIVEHQSVPWLIQWGMRWPNFLLLRVLGGLLLGMAIWGWRRMPGQRVGFILGMLSWVAAYSAVRNFTLFGLMAWPALAAGWQEAGRELAHFLPRPQRRQGVVLIAAAVVLLVYFQQFDAIQQRRRMLGIGLADGVNGAAEFIAERGLSGPLFNNYDNGGYLIYHLFPREHVFVDNRPEAYPAAFFADTYIPMQRDESVWREQMARHDFRLIVFYRRDLTDWGQQYLASRLRDPEWRLAFADAYHFIFTRAYENPAQ